MNDAAPGVRLPVYVVDAHALYWRFRDPSSLSRGAQTAFASTEGGGGEAIVPAIVVAEVYYLSRKLGRPFVPQRILDAIDATPGYAFSPLGRRQLQLLDQLTAIPEMHDRMIVADALVHGATVITRDPAIQASGLVPTLW